MRDIVIFVRGQVSQKIHFYLIRRLVRPIGLDIHEAGVVFRIRIHRTQKRTSALVSKAGYLRNLPHRTTYVCRTSEQTGRSRPFEMLRLLIGDIQHRTHLITITRLEASGREVHGFRQIGIHKAKPFLLPRANQEGAKHFDAIDIDDILVVTTASN